MYSTRPAGGQRRPPLRMTRKFVQARERADVGSELSAASGRSSEVSEWPRSKFPASAVRQRRNFGHRNRVIVPYGGLQEVRWGGTMWASSPTEGYKRYGKTGRRGNRRSAASGGRSELISRKCPDWRPQQWPGIGWHDGGQPPPPTEGYKECGGAGDRKGRPYGGGGVKFF